MGRGEGKAASGAQSRRVRPAEWMARWRRTTGRPQPCFCVGVRHTVFLGSLLFDCFTF